MKKLKPMKKLLLILLCVPLIGLAQEETVEEAVIAEENQEIYFEGVLESYGQWDGTFDITVKITKGKLAGELVDIYFQVSFEDDNRIECKGDVQSNISEGEGKNIKGKITLSTGEFENYATGGTDLKKIYRPLELYYK
jgi:hypothetical protein